MRPLKLPYIGKHRRHNPKPVYNRWVVAQEWEVEDWQEFTVSNIWSTIRIDGDVISEELATPCEVRISRPDKRGVRKVQVVVEKGAPNAG